MAKDKGDIITNILTSKFVIIAGLIAIIWFTGLSSVVFSNPAILIFGGIVLILVMMGGK